MTHLRRHLEQTGTLASEQLDAALRRQQIYGGSLDTVLLELEILDPHSLNELLQQACGLDVVPVDLLEGRVQRPDGVLPEELVSIGWAVPLAVIDNRLHVAVHPDLPNERLGSLYRSVPGVSPLVTPECALEKMAADLTGSVVPQRYAVLSAAYIGALRHRPSMSDAGMPLIPTQPPAEDTQRGRPPPHDPSAPAARESAMDLRRTQFYRRADIDRAIASTTLGVPQPVQTGDTQITHLSDHPSAHASAQDEVAPADAPPAAESGPAPAASPEPTASPEPESPPEPAVSSPPVSPPPPSIPPVRFIVPSTPASEPASPASPPGPSRALDSTLETLNVASTRDAVMEALVRGAMTVSSRVGLFRIKGDKLQGMSTPRSALADLGDKTIRVAKGSELEHAVGQKQWSGATADAALRNAVGVGAIVPCVTLRVDVAQRPTLLMYLDHAGREFETRESQALDTLVAAASDALERLIKARRAATSEPEPASPGSAGPKSAVPTPIVPEPSVPESGANTAPIIPPIIAAPPTTTRTVSPPPTFGTTGPAKWGPAPAELNRVSRVTPSPFEEESRPRRVTQLDGSATAKPPSDGTQERITVRVTPPVDGAQGAPEVEGPSATRDGPSFIPPEIDGRSKGGIIPLSSPIGEPSVRGRISLDDEDWAQAPDKPVEESQQGDIDAAIDAVARRGEDIGEVKAFGDAGLARLAALFPGPLEVLRRDLRALPPPSAHGPYIRLAIRLRSAIVPFVLELFPHPDPDVRFYAAFLFQELRDERCMAGLAKLAFDGSGDVRVISMRVLETYSRVAGFDAALAAVREELGGNNRTRQLYAARAVGTLRDVAAIPELVELLSSQDRFIQEASLESLCSVTGQQHGLKPHRWRTWYGDHGSEHRIEWVIQSLKHRDLPVRRWAHDELIRVTGHRIPFSPLGDKKSRDVAVDSWTQWWESTGRARFRVPGPETTGYAG